VRIDLARAQLVQGKAKDAEATLAAAPDSVERSVLLGAAASAQERWREAAGRFESALAGGGATPDLLNGLAWARFKLGEPARVAPRDPVPVAAQRPPDHHRHPSGRPRRLLRICGSGDAGPRWPRRPWRALPDRHRPRAPHRPFPRLDPHRPDAAAARSEGQWGL